MHKLLATLLVLLGCLTLVGQVMASSSAAYSDCCLQGCKGMVHCASATCQSCAAPQPAPFAGPVGLRSEPAHIAPSTSTTFSPGPGFEPWKPPD